MKILGIDSSGLVASVALVEDDIVRGEFTINYKKTHSETLLPMLDEMLNMINTKVDEVDGIAVAAGPGSFTGLRIGSSVAKGLGFALNKPLISVPTLEGMAYNLYLTEGLICPLMDARRNQVYAAAFQWKEKSFISVIPQEAIGIREFLDKVNKTQQPVIFLGDGVPVYREIIEEECKVEHFYAPAHLNKQRAASIAARGMEYYIAGKGIEASQFIPEYLRLSQAERERLEQERKDG